MLDTRELGRRPGSQRQVTRSVDAPADLGIEVLQVPEGSQVELDLRLESVMEGVLVTGTATAVLVGECARCLESIEDEVTVDLQELFVYDDQQASARDHGDDELEDETGRLEGDLLDLEPLLRDAVVLALPFQPLCRGRLSRVVRRVRRQARGRPRPCARGGDRPAVAGPAEQLDEQST